MAKPLRSNTPKAKTQKKSSSAPKRKSALEKRVDELEREVATLKIRRFHYGPIGRIP